MAKTETPAPFLAWKGNVVKTLVIGWMALGLAGIAGTSHAGMFAEMLIGASAVADRHARAAQPPAAKPAPVAASAPDTAEPPAQPSAPSANAGSVPCSAVVPGQDCAPTANRRAD